MKGVDPTSEVHEVSTRTLRQLGPDSFFEVRTAVDGTAHVFAIET